MLNEKQLLTVIELLAHKVKNPAHAMGINLEVLQSKIKKSRSDSAADLLKHVEITTKELNRLNLIIQRFTEYLMPGGQKQKTVKIKNLLAILRAATEPVAQTRQIELKFELADAAIKIEANSDEIRQAIEFIIINAIEASQPHNQIIVRAGSANNEVKIEIHDNGCGVQKETGKKIFDLYYTTKKDHVGMGLPLARKFIEENGGALRMRTAAQKGTQVFISFKG